MRAQGSPLRLLCRTLGVSRASFYRGRQGSAGIPRRHARCDETLAQRIRTIFDREETFGYRRVWAWLRLKQGGVWSIGRWCIGSCNVEGGNAACGTARLWATDTTKVWCGQDGWASLVGILDAGSRERLGARFARQGRAIEAIDALEQGVIRRYGSLTAVPQGLWLRHDNGFIFLARRFVGTAQQLAITQEFIPRYSPEYNGVIERCFRTLKQECVWLHHFQSFEEAERIITAWIDRYNTEQPHSGPRLLESSGMA